MFKNRWFYLMLSLAVLAAAALPSLDASAKAGLKNETAGAGSQQALIGINFSDHASDHSDEASSFLRAQEADQARWSAMGEFYTQQSQQAAVNRQLMLEDETARWANRGPILAAMEEAAAVLRLLGQDTNVSSKVLKDLASVRSATSKYLNVDKALANGYIPTSACMEEPGVGGMGFHYINPALIQDPEINLATPEVLLYAEVGGKLKLVGVEYFVAIGAPDAAIPQPAPSAPVLFQRQFDGPMMGHEPGMPPHYDLHVWLWELNPEGMFSPLNPRVTCN